MRKSRFTEEQIRLALLQAEVAYLSLTKEITMSNAQIMSKLQQLQPCSNKHLPDSVITGMTLSFTHARTQLIRSRSNPSGAGYIYVPTQGTSSLLQNTRAIRKLMALPAGVEDNYTHMLNTALMGGTSYPILEAVLGTVTGAVSAGAGLLFTVAGTALSLSKTSQRVLARLGDELWQVEEIGKDKTSKWFDGDAKGAVHIASYFLVDPYRGRGPVKSKGWLIHEERTELTLL